MEEKKGNKIVIVIVLLILLISLGVGGYLLFKGKSEKSNKEVETISNYTAKNDEKEKNGEKEPTEENSKVEATNDNTTEEINKTEEQKSTSNNKVFKSSDGKFTLKFVGRNELKESDKAKIPATEAKYYAYINEHAVAIDNVESDGIHTVYKGKFFESAGNYSSFLIDNRTNTLIVYPYYDSSKFSGDEVFYRFSTGIDGLEYALSYLELEIGEFFIQTTNGPANKLYTTDWKELGWFATIEYDIDGVFVYDNYNLTGNKIKYDVNGKKMTSVGASGPFYVVDTPAGKTTIDIYNTERNLIEKVNNGSSNVEIRSTTTCQSGVPHSFDTKILDTSAITKVINKLKEAKEVEYMPTSKTCVLYNFHVGSDLIAFEADDPTIMLVGVNGEGFAFHYNESVIDFFKSL